MMNGSPLTCDNYKELIQEEVSTEDKNTDPIVLGGKINLENFQYHIDAARQRIKEVLKSEQGPPLNISIKKPKSKDNFLLL